VRLYLSVHPAATPRAPNPDRLQTWAELGAKNEKELKDLLLKRSLKPVSTLGAQV
jgi:hypothetical protein